MAGATRRQVGANLLYAPLPSDTNLPSYAAGRRDIARNISRTENLRNWYVGRLFSGRFGQPIQPDTPRAVFCACTLREATQ